MVDYLGDTLVSATFSCISEGQEEKFSGWCCRTSARRCALGRWKSLATLFNFVADLERTMIV